MSSHVDDRDLETTTLGAQRQIDEIRGEMRRGLKAMFIAVVLIVVGFTFTGWQITRAFDAVERERRDRVDALASINTFLCQRIDAVGNGVASLVRISLENSPRPMELEPAQRIGFYKFLHYAEEQEEPPRCRELALQIAVLTGADPEDITITPIRLRPERRREG